MDAECNIILIGMPGVGKSTAGVLLAKATGRSFLDTDVWIQTREGRTLQEILDAEGLRAFCTLEERHIRSIDARGCVIATGGSVIYSAEAMGHPMGRSEKQLEPLRRIMAAWIRRPADE